MNSGQGVRVFWEFGEFEMAERSFLPPDLLKEVEELEAIERLELAGK